MNQIEQQRDELAEKLMWNTFMDYLIEKHPYMALWIDSECELRVEEELKVSHCD